MPFFRVRPHNSALTLVIMVVKQIATANRIFVATKAVVDWPVTQKTLLAEVAEVAEAVVVQPQAQARVPPAVPG